MVVLEHSLAWYAAHSPCSISLGRSEHEVHAAAVVSRQPTSRMVKKVRIVLVVVAEEGVVQLSSTQVLLNDRFTEYDKPALFLPTGFTNPGPRARARTRGRPAPPPDSTQLFIM